LRTRPRRLPGGLRLIAVERRAWRWLGPKPERRTAEQGQVRFHGVGVVHVELVPGNRWGALGPSCRDRIGLYRGTSRRTRVGLEPATVEGFARESVGRRGDSSGTPSLAIDSRCKSDGGRDVAREGEEPRVAREDGAFLEPVAPRRVGRR